MKARSLGSAPFVLGKSKCKEMHVWRIRREKPAHLLANTGNTTFKLKVTKMKKFAFVLAAFVLFAPVAYAALYQAALIVA